MATIFSVFHRLFTLKSTCGYLCALLIFSTTGSTFGQFLPKFGRVVTAKDKAAADTAYQEAFAAFQTGDYARTLTLATQADRLKPDQPDGWNLRGMAHLRQKEFGQAQTAFTRAVALDPEFWAARFNLAETAFQQKDYARGRKEFERLLSQTNRFKESSRWEMVQYKAFMCCLLQGNGKDAAEKLARLPKTGGATPARLYAEAALSYQAKQNVAAQKSIAAAQSSYPAPVNELFAGALVEAGWQTAPPLPFPANGTAALAANNGLPPGVTLATSIPGQSPPPYYVVDPKLEAAVAEPLPLPDTGAKPIIGKLAPASRTLPTDVAPVAAVQLPATTPAPMVVAHTLPVPEATPDTEIEHRDLLMIE